MEGTFKGWTPNTSFGFITPNDNSEDVFIHKSEVSSPSAFRRGLRVSFEIHTTEKGPNAVHVKGYNLETEKDSEKCQGRIKFWNDNGYGFIGTQDDSSDVFVHMSEINPREGGYLCEGYVVEYTPREGRKGIEALNVEVVGWNKCDDHLGAFADLGGPGWLDTLSDMAEDEHWEYSHTTASEPMPILRSYVRHTFRRLEEMESGISVSSDGKNAAFNTGLVTPNQEEIYAFFRKNPKHNRQPWLLGGFKKNSDWDFMAKFAELPPPLANYFDDPSVLLYDRRCELIINIDHVMEHLERFPKHLQDNDYVARQLLISAEATTKKRVYRNYKTAIPQYYRDKNREGIVQLLMPICLENPGRADLALVVEKHEEANKYRGSTVLTLDMAYNNARLLARPDSEWLQP